MYFQQHDFGVFKKKEGNNILLGTVIAINTHTGHVSQILFSLAEPLVYHPQKISFQWNWKCSSSSRYGPVQHLVKTITMAILY